jgi:charged multivesicular body protein 2B
MFGKKPSVPEQTKAHSRELRKTDRELGRDRHKLEAEEQRLVNEIRKNATTGNKKAVEILAKQLVKVRNQKAQSLQASGHIQGLATQNTMMASNVRMANAMGATANTMAKMNKVINPEEMSKITQQFAQEHTKLTITDEMIGETLEAALGQEGDSEEEDAIVNQVLDEIGISLDEKMANAPRVPVTATAATNRRQTNEEDAEIERMLANLKS